MAQQRDPFQELERGVVRMEQRLDGEIKRLPHLHPDRPPVRNVNEQYKASFSPLERIALWVT